MPKPAPGLVRDLIRLVRTRSVTCDSNAAAARLAASMMRKAGFRVQIQSVRQNGRKFYNAVGIKGPAGRPLMLCAHLDTVPSGPLARWTRTGGNPWRATRAGNILYGLGAADDKASLTAQIRAGSRIKASELKRPLLVLATFGEESGMGGAWLFRRAWRGPKPFAAFVGEPTSLTVTYRHKGMGVIELDIRGGDRGRSTGREAKKTFRGKQGHSSRPWLGQNALEKALVFLRSRAARGKSVAKIDGGAAPNLIPGHAEVTLSKSGGFPAALITACDGAVKKVLKTCMKRRDASFYPACITSNFGVARTEPGRLRFQYDFRLLPGQSVTDIERKIRKALREGTGKFSNFRCATAVERANPPLGGRPRDPLVRFAQSALRARGHHARLVTKPSCTEAGVYYAWGVPAVIFGPGMAAGNIHAPNEKVSLSEVARAAELYEAIVRAACSGDAPCF